MNFTRVFTGLAVAALAVITLAGTALAGTAMPASAGTVPAPAPSGKPSLSTTVPPPRHVTQNPVRPPPKGAKGPAGRTGRAALATCQLLFMYNFSTDNTTVATGSTVTLTVNWTCDIKPTPYYLEIFDTTTGALVDDTGFGNSLTVPISQDVAGTHDYVAYLGDWISAYPPSGGIFEVFPRTIYVTWQDPPNNFSVSLSGPSIVPSGQPGTYTATSNQDVGPTPYWIEIFDTTTGTLLGDCGFGTSCSVTFQPSIRAGDNLVAFVSSLSSSLPPANAQASSSVMNTVSD